MSELHKMNLHPFTSCVNQWSLAVHEGGCQVFQQFLCSHCGAKQTMDVPNSFFLYGTCEECDPQKITDIRKHGMNVMVMYSAEFPSATLNVVDTSSEGLKGKDIK